MTNIKKNISKVLTKKKTIKKKGVLINGVLEKIPSRYFEAVGKQLRLILNRKAGIYALYKDEKLYYVGLATNAFNRIKNHLKGRKQNKWNNFSIFLVKNGRYLKDIETSVIRIAKPKGNKLQGKIHEHNNLKRALRNSIKEKKKDLRIKLNKRTNELKKIQENIELVEEALTKRK